MQDVTWYDLALPDGTPLLAYDPAAELDGRALRLSLKLEAASAELVAESGVLGALHLPEHPELELRLSLVMDDPPAPLGAALAAAGDDVLAALATPAAARAHELGAFEVVDIVAVVPSG